MSSDNFDVSVGLTGCRVELEIGVEPNNFTALSNCVEDKLLSVCTSLKPNNR